MSRLTEKDTRVAVERKKEGAPLLNWDSRGHWADRTSEGAFRNEETCESIGGDPKGWQVFIDFPLHPK